VVVGWFLLNALILPAGFGSAAAQEQAAPGPVAISLSAGRHQLGAGLEFMLTSGVGLAARAEGLPDARRRSRECGARPGRIHLRRRTRGRGFVRQPATGKRGLVRWHWMAEGRLRRRRAWDFPHATGCVVGGRGGGVLGRRWEGRPGGGAGHGTFAATVRWRPH